MSIGVTLPNITPLTLPFWDGTRHGKFLLPKCNCCGKHFFRPEVACTHCFATDWSWVEASGRGTLYSYSVIHRAPARGFKTPLVFAVVELEESPVIFSNLVECELDDIRIGMPLEVTFDEISPGIMLPKFRPRGKQ